MKNISTNQIIIGVVLLIIGFGLGYAVRGSQSTTMNGHQMVSGVMPR